MYEYGTIEKSGEKTIEINLEKLNDALVWTYIIAAYRNRIMAAAPRSR